MQTTIDEFDIWETKVTQIVADRMGIPYGDAAGMIEANSFVMVQAWGREMTPEKTATTILKASITQE